MVNMKSYADVWDAVSEGPSEAANLKIRSMLMIALAEYVPEAANLKIRSMLMIALAEYVERQKITQAEAAKRFGVPRSRVSELVNGRISKFSIDRLVNMAARVHLETHIVVKQSSGESWIVADEDSGLPTASSEQNSAPGAV